MSQNEPKPKKQGEPGPEGYVDGIDPKPISAELLRELRSGYAELNAFELEERRRATPADRMKQLDSIWRMAREMGRLKLDAPADTRAREQWAKLRDAYDERHGTNSK